MCNLPRLVWMFWAQGWDDCPAIVRGCRQSWQERNPDWDVRVLDATTVGDVLPALASQGDLPYATYADRVRIELLRRHGGVWADATAFCHVPLDEWLPGQMPEGFFAFTSPAPGRMLSNWFLAGTTDSNIVRTWGRAAEAYWRDRSRAGDYYWSHYLFGQLYAADPDFAAAWDRTPPISADGPHYFAPYGRRFTRPLTPRAEARLAARVDPVYKLTHRIAAHTAGACSAFEYFAAGGRLPLKEHPELLVGDRWLEAGRRVALDAREGAYEVARTVRRRLRGS